MQFLKICLSISLCCSLFSIDLYAQKKDGAADDVYDHLGYKSSISLYQNKKNVSLSDMAKIANAYRLNHDTENAEFWYSQVITKSNDPKYYLFLCSGIAK